MSSTDTGCDILTKQEGVKNSLSLPKAHTQLSVNTINSQQLAGSCSILLLNIHSAAFTVLVLAYIGIVASYSHSLSSLSQKLIPLTGNISLLLKLRWQNVDKFLIS